MILSLFTAFFGSVQALDWATDTRITVDPGWDVSPSIVQASDGKIWVVWTSSRTGNNEIFYKTYDGSMWSDETQLTNDPEKDVSPSVMQAADGKIWIVWNTYRGTLDYDVYYKVFDGVSWSADTELVVTLTDDNSPAIAQTTDDDVWVIWSSLRTGDAEIFYKVFDGVNWSSDVRLTIDSNSDDEYPCIMQTRDGLIWVAYSKTARATGKWGDIYYRTFNGVSWSAEIQLTSHVLDDVHPALMQSINDRIWLVWESDRDGGGNSNIYYRIFDGVSWTSDTRLTSAMEPDQTPAVAQTHNASITVAWASRRIAEQFDIYCRTGMELHDVAVLDVSYYASRNTTAFRGEKVYVEIGVQNNGEAREPVVEVRCYANLSLIGSRTVALAFGQYYSLVFDWQTDLRAKPGMYVISGETVPVLGETDVGDNSLVGGAVELRIKGDIVGVYEGVVQPIPDKRVNIDDFSIPIIHYGCHTDIDHPWPHAVWDPVANVYDRDPTSPFHIIDLDDIMTVGVHFGET